MAIAVNSADIAMGCGKFSLDQEKGVYSFKQNFKKSPRQVNGEATATAVFSIWTDLHRFCVFCKYTTGHCGAYSSVAVLKKKTRKQKKNPKYWKRNPERQTFVDVP